ncbi:hypothetical protein F5Y15DRAFT_418083 [Xylariaceae sp. FL0016]|nr:hypothetical protein F5Y15DRAFT_418083 [Xylariaceae sp. FL0016]
MPVTIVLPHQPRPCQDVCPEKSDLQFLAKACPKDAIQPSGTGIHICEGTWKDITDSDNIIALSDGFLRVSFYMKANSESVRHLFASHQGQKEICIHYTDVQTVMNTFSTAIQHSNTLMVGTMQAYFKHSFDGLNYVQFFGKEPIQYMGRLGSLLEKFVLSFHDPTTEEIVRSWDGIVVAERGGRSSRPDLDISGWILDPFRWDVEGRPTRAIVSGTLAKSLSAGAPTRYYDALKRPVPGDDPDLLVYTNNNLKNSPGCAEKSNADRSGSGKLRKYTDQLTGFSCLCGFLQVFKRKHVQVGTKSIHLFSEEVTDTPRSTGGNHDTPLPQYLKSLDSPKVSWKPENAPLWKETVHPDMPKSDLNKPGPSFPGNAKKQGEVAEKKEEDEEILSNDMAPAGDYLETHSVISFSPIDFPGPGY